MNLPQVEASNGKHRKTWRPEELDDQAFTYRVNGGFPIPTGRRRASIFETIARRTK